MKKTLISIIVLIQSFMGFTQSSKNINLLSNFYPTGYNSISDVWGYVDSLGNEYALVADIAGLSIVDVTNPTVPIEVFNTSVGMGNADIKIWNNHAYIVPSSAIGLIIIDLSNLPGIITTNDVYSYSGSTYPFTFAHNLFIDENGICYIVNSNGISGVTILDLTIDPQNPIELGVYTDFNIHDVMVRGDTMWASAILDGKFAVVDVSDKANPVTMATQITPNAFTHNCWISDDGQTLYTTDEVSGAFITAYDVSNLSNISELDKIQSNPGNNVLPHNTLFINDYLVTSYYNDGVVIHDVSNPNNMIEVGHYDTSPTFSGGSFNGCWGVYPYLPSGNILATDRENGLFILGPTYVRGVSLKGNVINSTTLLPIDSVLIEIVSTTITANTNTIGDYITGVADTGMYNIIYSKIGFKSDTIFNLQINTTTTIQNIQLDPLVTSVKKINDLKEIQIFPNPFEFVINLAFTSKEVKKIKIEIFDITGRLIDKKDFKNSDNIKFTNNYKKGTYFINVYKDGELIKTQKLIKF